MTMWTYYQQTYAAGMWILFREDESGREEAFHRQDGWQATDQLSARRQIGEIDSSDEIGEVEAEALIRSVATAGAAGT